MDLDLDDYYFIYLGNGHGEVGGGGYRGSPIGAQEGLRNTTDTLLNTQEKADDNTGNTIFLVFLDRDFTAIFFRLDLLGPVYLLDPNSLVACRTGLYADLDRTAKDLDSASGWGSFWLRFCWRVEDLLRLAGGRSLGAGCDLFERCFSGLASFCVS